MNPWAKIIAIILTATFVQAAVIIVLPDDVHKESGKIGIAWHPNPSQETYRYTCRSVEAAGAAPTILDQVVSYDLEYDDSGKLIGCVDERGSLNADSADKIKNGGWRNSNVREVMKDITIVIFPGGDDISHNLYAKPVEWVDSGEDYSFSPERDVSDYIAMSYCLEMDIPLVGICRGMQMLSVVSGAEMIQDIPSYFEDLSIDYHYEHRNKLPSPGGYRNFSPHDVDLVKGSVISGIMGVDTVRKCPSWHHQAVMSVENTGLVVTGTTDTDGIPIIEQVERTDKKCTFGIQYHPEAAVGRHLDDLPDKDLFMDLDSAMALFEWIAGYASADA